MAEVRAVGRTGTSRRPVWCIVLLCTGTVFLAVVGSVPNSPLATRLPRGAHPPSLGVHVARWMRLDRIGRPGLIAVSLAIVAGLVVAFVVLLPAAWACRVWLASVLRGSAVALVASVAAPALLSRPACSYADSGSL